MIKTKEFKKWKYNKKREAALKRIRRSYALVMEILNTFPKMGYEIISMVTEQLKAKIMKMKEELSPETAADAKEDLSSVETIIMLPFIKIEDWYPDGLGGVNDFDNYLVLIGGIIYHAFYIGDRHFQLLHNNQEVIPNAWQRILTDEEIMTQIKEGNQKKGGVNKAPTCEKPKIKPPARYAEAKSGHHETVDMLPWVAKKIIEARDAHVRGDYEEVWHTLYSIASPKFDKLDPWGELEELAEMAT